MIAGRDPFDIITIVIIWDTLHNDFKSIIASILENNNKTIEEI